MAAQLSLPEREAREHGGQRLDENALVGPHQVQIELLRRDNIAAQRSLPVQGPCRHRAPGPPECVVGDVKSIEVQFNLEVLVDVVFGTLNPPVRVDVDGRQHLASRCCGIRHSSARWWRAG